MTQATTLPKWLIRLTYFSSFCVVLYFGFYTLETYKQNNWLGLALAGAYLTIGVYMLFTFQHVTRNPITQTVPYSPMIAESSEFASRIYPTGEYVYLIQDVTVTGYFKIGKTNNPSRRMYDFGVLLPMQVKVIHVISCQNMSQLESQLHRQYQAKRINGEWFALSQTDVDYIKSL